MQRSEQREIVASRDGTLRATLLSIEQLSLHFTSLHLATSLPRFLCLHITWSVLPPRPLSSDFSTFLYRFSLLTGLGKGGGCQAKNIYINVSEDGSHHILTSKKTRDWKWGKISPQCAFVCVWICTSTCKGSGLWVRLQIRFAPRRLIREDQWSCNVFRAVSLFCHISFTLHHSFFFPQESHSLEVSRLLANCCLTSLSEAAWYLDLYSRDSNNK